MSEPKKPAEPAGSGDAAFRALIRRAESGDESSLPALREALKEPDGLVESVGNLALQVEHTLIRNAAGKSLLFKEAAYKKMEQLRKDLAGDSPTPLERLLAERIALCWLSVHDAEIRFAQSSDLTFRQAEHWQYRIDCAHKRYLWAIKTLATVRKLAAPAIQVNVAKRQVNVLKKGGDG